MVNFYMIYRGGTHLLYRYLGKGCKQDWLGKLNDMPILSFYFN